MRFVELETSSKCNRRCVWCPTGKKAPGDEQHLMEWSTFIGIIEQLSVLHYSGWLALHNFNEPLLNPRLFEELTFAKSRLPDARLSIFTNGDHLRRETMDRLDRIGLAHLRVTRYPIFGAAAPSSASEVAQSLRRWERARDLDIVDDLRFRRTYRGWEGHGRHRSFVLQVIAPDVTGYSNRADSVPVAAPAARRRIPCELTSTSVAIDWKGRLKMCCNVSLDEPDHHSYVIGSLEGSTIDRLWTGPRMSDLRDRHAVADWTASAICRRCTHAVEHSQSA